MARVIGSGAMGYRHPKAGGASFKSSINRMGKGHDYISGAPSKAPNPFKQARAMVTRSTGAAKLGTRKPY